MILLWTQMVRWEDSSNWTLWGLSLWWLQILKVRWSARQRPHFIILIIAYHRRLNIYNWSGIIMILCTLNLSFVKQSCPSILHNWSWIVWYHHWRTISILFLVSLGTHHSRGLRHRTLRAARTYQSVSLCIICGLLHCVKAGADASLFRWFFMLKLKLAHMLIVRIDELHSSLFEPVSLVLKIMIQVDILQLECAIAYYSCIKWFHIFISNQCY